MTGIGLALWAAAVATAMLFVTRRERRRVAECEGLLALLRHIRAAVSSYGLPKGEIYRSFSSEVLEDCGFLSLLREKGLAAALAAELLIMKGERLRPLIAFASGEGMRLTAEELTACERAEGEVERLLQTMKEHLPERLRLSRTLVLTVGMMVAILLI